MSQSHYEKVKVVVSGMNDNLVEQLDKHWDKYKSTAMMECAFIYPEHLPAPKGYAKMLEEYLITNKVDLYIYCGDKPLVQLPKNVNLILCNEKNGKFVFSSNDEKIDIYSLICIVSANKLLGKANYSGQISLQGEKNKNLEMVAISLLVVSIASATAAITIVSLGTAPLIVFILLAALSISTALMSIAESVSMGLELKIEDGMQGTKNLDESKEGQDSFQDDSQSNDGDIFDNFKYK